MHTILSVVFLIAMFLAWAIGGEEKFGKWRRGALLAVPMTILGLFSLPWYLHLVQIIALWVVYQGISYDWAVRAIYENNKPLKGWPVIGLNGALIGLSATAFMIDRGSWLAVIASEIVAMVGFVGVIILSNDIRFKSYRDWLNKYMPIAPYLNFKSAWYVSSGLMGLILGIICLILK